MDKKIIIAICIVLCLPVSLYSQEDAKERSHSRCIRDQYGIITKSITGSSMIYVTKTGKELTISLPLNSIHYKVE